jgi:hypothetical protein
MLGQRQSLWGVQVQFHIPHPINKISVDEEFPARSDVNNINIAPPIKLGGQGPQLLSRGGL